MLIKIGQTVVNLDQVRCIRDCSGQPGRKLFRFEFDPEHVVEISSCYDELKTWLQANTTTIMLTPP